MKRGEIVIIDFSATSPTAGVRPALVIQNDRDNARMKNTIVAQVTTNTSRAGEDTQLLIDTKHPDWAASGLRHASVVNCSNLATVAQADIRKIIGALSTATMQQLDDCLRAALHVH
jgi:mRNA interferase MazF